MVNSADFIKRLEIVLQYYNISASAFADKIDVQRSSISHLLAGRNKPSLEFVLKIVKNYPEVNLYWLLNGKGTFPAELSEANSPISLKETNKPNSGKPPKTVKKVVLFYDDGSFETYENNK